MQSTNKLDGYIKSDCAYKIARGWWSYILSCKNNMYLTIIKIIAKYQEADLFKNGHMVFFGMIIELLKFLN